MADLIQNPVYKTKPVQSVPPSFSDAPKPQITMPPTPKPTSKPRPTSTPRPTYTPTPRATTTPVDKPSTPEFRGSYPPVAIVSPPSTPRTTTSTPTPKPTPTATPTPTKKAPAPKSTFKGVFGVIGSNK